MSHRLKITLVFFLFACLQNVYSQINTQTNLIELSSAGCFVGDLPTNLEIDIESFCFDNTYLSESCYATQSGRHSSFCFTFEPFTPSCGPATILGINYNLKSSLSWECDTEITYELKSEDGEIIEAMVNNGGFLELDITENLQEAISYEMCISMQANSLDREGCEVCIDGIEREVIYECGQPTECCESKIITSIPDGPVFMQEGEQSPLIYADYLAGPNPVYEETSLSEFYVVSDPRSRSIEIKGNPYQVLENTNLIAVKNGANSGRVAINIDLSGVVMPKCGYLSIKSFGASDEEYLSAKLRRLSNDVNVSVLLVKNLANLTDIDIDNDNLVDPNINVIDGLDLVQNINEPELTYARSVGYSAYNVPEEYEGTHTYKNSCIWNPSDPSNPTSLITPGAPNGRVYWALSEQGDDNIIKFLKEQNFNTGIVLDELESGEFCLKPVIIYSESDYAPDLISFTNYTDVNQWFNGESICAEFGPCTPISVGPCSFDNFNIPDETICKDECVVIDINNTCEITSQFCVSWGGNVPFTETHNTSIEVCPIETTVYPLTITDENGNFITSENVTVTVVDLEVEILPNPAIFCDPDMNSIDLYTNLNTTNNFQWSTGATSSSILVDEEGIYSVTVTSENNCIATDEMSVINPLEPESIKQYLAIEGYVDLMIPIMIGSEIPLTNPNIQKKSYTSNLNINDYASVYIEIEGEQIDVATAIIDDAIDLMNNDNCPINVQIVRNESLCNGDFDLANANVNSALPGLSVIIFIWDDGSGNGSICAKSFGSCANSIPVVGVSLNEEESALTCGKNFQTFKECLSTAETLLIDSGFNNIEDRIHMLRGIYYGTNWSVDFSVENSSVRNDGFNNFTKSSPPIDPRPFIGNDLFNDLRECAEIQDGNKKIDFGHLIIGLDARDATFSNVPIPLMGGNGTELVTWLGDLGGAAGTLAIRRVDNPDTRAITVFQGASSFGASVNLEGNLAAYLVAKGNSMINSLSPSYEQDELLVDHFANYICPDELENSAWENRAELFLECVFGAELDDECIILNEQEIVEDIASKIESFGEAYMVNRLRQNEGGFGDIDRDELSQASSHLSGVSIEIAQIFIETLRLSKLNESEKIQASGDGPDPTPAGTPYAKYQVIDNIIDWIRN